MTTPFVPVAALRRGDFIESTHCGVGVVFGPGPWPLLAFGDPSFQTFVRSSAKPFQALPFVCEGGVERFELEPADLALLCASHSGSEEHAARTRSLLKRGGFGVEDLLCGLHPPLDPKVAEDLAQRRVEIGADHNNCSGKHAGMLLATLLLGVSKEDYVGSDHPLQRRIREVVGRAFEVSGSGIGEGIDGCSVPTFHVSVTAAARAYRGLADPSLATKLTAQEQQALQRIGDAMGAAPTMVAGEGRFTTRLIEATSGRILGKEGAEGFYAMAVRGSSPLGIAFKIVDGGDRVRDVLALELLHRLDLLSKPEAEALESFRRPEVLNHRHHRVGSLEVLPF